MRSDPLEGESLPTALARLARKFTSETGVQVTLLPSASASLGAPVEFAFYRIAGEALANVRRHARARRVTMKLDVDEGRAELSVRDDGIGFTAAETKDGFGLRGMRERAESLGGVLSVVSDESGTTVNAVIPTVHA